jgi:flagellar biogenesis protein FliO
MMAGITLVLALCGGVAAAARRLSSQGPAGVIRVVSRVSISPKHSVYLLRVGRRVLLVGAGPQGPPSLISELDELAEIEPNHRPGEEA